MANYQDAQGNIIQVANPDLNPDLIAGKTLIGGSSDTPNPTQTINSSNLAPTTPTPYVNPKANFFDHAATIAGIDTTTQNMATQPGPQETAISQRINDLNAQNNALAGRTTFTQQQETQQGLPGLQQTQNDLVAQIKGYQQQSLALQNQSQYTIPNQVTNDSLGRRSVGQINAMTDQQRRSLQIQQGDIATRALTASAALQAIQGNIANAQNLVDRAVAAKYGPIEEDIKIKQANLDLLLKDPNLTIEQKNRANAQQQILNQQQADIAAKKENKTIAMPLILAAMTNNPNNATAQFNAQQALKLDSNDPQYLQKVMGFVSQYQKDPVAVQKALDAHLQAQATLNKTNAEIKKIQIENPLSPNGRAVGTTGSNIIDATASGYSTNIVSGTGGLTQAAIDQDALATALGQPLPVPLGLSSTGAGGQKRTAINNRLAEINTGGNVAANKTKLTALASSLKTQTAYSNIVERSLGAAENGYNQVYNTFSSKGINDFSMPLANIITNYAKYNLGSGDLNAFRGGLTEVANEYTQVFSRGGQISDTVRNQAAKITNGDININDLKQVVDELQTQGKIVLQSTKDQVNKIQDQINGIIGGNSNTNNNSGNIYISPDGKQQASGLTSQQQQEAINAGWKVKK